MIGIIVIGVIVGYILLSKFIVTKVLQSHGLKKANIALAIMILIPTWDVILGFPVYAYLCAFESGIKIYKSVDNVEGFYVGKWSKDGYGNVPPLPYEGYRYIDYQEVKNNKPTGKYFRTSWVDTNKTQECIQIGNASSEYHLNLYKQGKCIVKEEIDENEVSGWEFAGYKIGSETEIPIININRVISFKFFDKKSNATLGELVEYSWGVGWIRNLLGYFIGVSGFGCSGIGKTNYEELYIKILKPKERGEN
ncbi:MAG: hypothetical protein PHO62_03965 [Sulfurimonas sp.]|uniref:hypothetical protein n=1 Tax=Sulfurimonas sp. TaxID=2022749 RepID=UPI00260A7388|nr:hypothetical protein [Sulfurimonas sp.]MDD5372566.1 hypothetical protein [Sulfurimonas sp.]